MRALVQRVTRAAVRVDGDTVGSIGPGLLVLLGVFKSDTEEHARRLAERIAGLRIFADASGHMNRSVIDTQGEVLVVSQFTLAGATDRGLRPSFEAAAPPETAEPLYQVFVDRIVHLGLRAATGRFRAMMEVELVNDGPVTILLDEPKRALSSTATERPGREGDPT